MIKETSKYIGIAFGIFFLISIFLINPYKYDLEDPMVGLIMVINAIFWGFVVYKILQISGEAVTNSSVVKGTQEKVSNMITDKKWKTDYEKNKQSFMYFSNDKLLEIHKEYKAKNIIGPERMALEELLVEKKIISYSKFIEDNYDKLSKLK